MLHCIENEVMGGFSTLVDGYTVTEILKKQFPEFYKILTKVKIRFQFVDRNIVLESWAEMIQLDENNKLKQVRFKLCPGDLLMMDNHRLLHGRTTYDANEGNRFLKGCYIDYDSTEGKLKHLRRKFNI